MKSFFSLRITPFFGLVLFFFTACQDDQLTPTNKEKILNRIGQILERKAYASDTNFDSFEELWIAQRAALDSAQSVEEFAHALNEILSGYAVSHLAIWTPREVKQRTNASSTGIGVRMTKTPNGYFINQVMDKSPAERAGILNGDCLLKVDGLLLLNSSLLYGNKGDSIELTLLRQSDTILRKLEFFEHRPYSRDSMYWLTPGTAVIEVHSFRSNLYDRRTIEQFFMGARNADHVILDLRSNGGGNSENVRHLLAMVLDPDTPCQYIVHREEYDAFLKKNKETPASLKELAVAVNNVFDPMTVARSHPVFKNSLTVLIDERSGSGADVFPACIQDLGRGSIVGTTSAGKVLAGDIKDLPMGLQLLYPTGEHIRLDGSRIEGNGVVPDILLDRESTANDSLLIDAFLEKY